MVLFEKSNANTSLLSKVGLLFSLDMLAGAGGVYLGLGVTSGWAVFFLFAVSIMLLFVIKGLENVNMVAAAAAAIVFALLCGMWIGPFVQMEAIKVGWSGIMLAFLGSSLAMTVFGGIGAFSGRDFSSWGPFLFQALLGLIIVRLIFIFLPGMAFTQILSGLAGVVLFSGYFVYDFYKASHDDNTWSSAIDHSVEIFLDFVNFFVSLLEIMGAGKK